MMSIIGWLALTFTVVALVIAHIAKTRKPTASTTTNPFRKDF